MTPGVIIELVFGAILAFGAVVALAASLDEPLALILAVAFGGASAILIKDGLHRDSRSIHAEHVAIYRDALRAGFPVRSSDVNAGYGSTLDIRAGRCLFSLEARKVDGRWRFGVPESGQGSAGGVVFLRPSDVAKLRDACPS